MPGRYVLSAPSKQLETLPGTLMLTDCLEACQANESCSAVNYETGLCVMFRSTADQLPGEWGTLVIWRCVYVCACVSVCVCLCVGLRLTSSAFYLRQVHFPDRNIPFSRSTHRNPALVCDPAQRPGASIVCRATVCRSMPSLARAWPRDATASSCAWAKRSSPAGKW